MKYVALLSGGKDSCYNLLHCQKNGHELVAAASLRPEQGKDEIDSYMYQTVGQDAIETVSKALDVPLYRRVIAGDAVHMGSEYGARKADGPADLKGDETEDLYELLSTVLQHHPEVKGVSVGAILSNYQRVRVEHVCRRLGLTSLAYLWQRDQEELLSEMIEAGLTAVLIKVAGIGLTVKHLGKSLQEMQPILLKLNSLYGSHVCGEGGEYETLTIDSPMFKSKIVLKDVETVIHSDSDFATVAYLRVKDAELENKSPTEEYELPIPRHLEERYEELLEDEAYDEPPNLDTLSLKEPVPVDSIDSEVIAFPTQSHRVGNWVSVSNIQQTQDSRQTFSIEEEVSACFQILKDELQKYDLEIHHCANINIFLSSMDLFARVNEVYGSFFGTSPPARACVAVALPQGTRVRLDVVAFTEQKPGERHAHHVQGLSYWAPANIGPYSQAIMAQEQVFVSGQIGLIPSNLMLANSLQMQTALASQHAGRILEALASNTGSNWNPVTQLNIYWFEDGADLLRMKRSKLVELDIDAPTLFVSVSSLPKGAKIEKQTFVHAGRVPYSEEEEEDDEYSSLLTSTNDDLHNSSACTIRVSRRTVGSSVTTLVFGKGDVSSELAAQLPIYEAPLSSRVFYSPRRMASASCLSAITALHLEGIPAIAIPCSHISSREEDDWDYAICTISLGRS